MMTPTMPVAGQAVVPQGAAEFYSLTPADAEQIEADAWTQYEAARKVVEKTPEHQVMTAALEVWLTASAHLELTKKAALAESIGRSGIAASNEQADHLRRVVAAGARPTRNEAY